MQYKCYSKILKSFIQITRNVKNAILVSFNLASTYSLFLVCVIRYKTISSVCWFGDDKQFETFQARNIILKNQFVIILEIKASKLYFRYAKIIKAYVLRTYVIYNKDFILVSKERINV